MSVMKLQFDANQQYQHDAIGSIVDIFDGQTMKQGEFSAYVQDDTLHGRVTDLGYANRMDLSHEDLLKNVITIQDRNRLARSKNIIDDQYGVPNFAIEMETGTGKTYVYTRTIMELNKRYGMTKFIIVMPSVAIREGVYKSLQVTREHFEQLYPGQGCNYFIYDSKKLNQVRSFATSDAIEIMIINIDAFRKGFSDLGPDMNLEKTANVIHKPSDQLDGRAPIEFIQQTSPIVIIDEPQSVDNTDKAKEAIKSLNPTAILRYSATHKATYNLMYRLGPVEAHDQKLVKTIEVVSVEDEKVDNAHVKFIQLYPKTRQAKIEINSLGPNGMITKKEVKAKTGDDLFDLSNGNQVYGAHAIASINADPDNPYIEFENGEILEPNTVSDDMDIKRAQIKSTIQAHLEKELLLTDKGIKVISLFFIDKVANYRLHTEGGYEKGVYAEIFEKEYSELIKHSKYQTLFNTEKTDSYILNPNASEVHDGYFSQDKKGFKDTKGNTNADDDTYSLIMKDKEKLLDIKTPLRFIFSHSALKEGWDNPNVFQVCTLVESQDTMTKRQKIGRGLRLPVYSEGEFKGTRMKDSQYNILTVIANESYKTFADELQIEIEKETNTKFGVIEARLFESIVMNGNEIGYDKAEKLVNYLKDKNLIDRDEKATQELKNKVVLGDLELPEELKEIESVVIERIKRVTRRLPILDANDKVKFTLNKEIYLSPDFKELWNKIKHKTVYRLNFESDELQRLAILKVKSMRPVKENTIVAKYVTLKVGAEGVEHADPYRIHTITREYYKENPLPNILGYVEQYTGLKRMTIANILKDSEKLNQFYTNPQVFMEQVVEQINLSKRELIVDGIEYEKIGDQEYWKQELFEEEELIGYIKENALEVSKSVYSHVIYDSTTIEKPFAEKLNIDDDVKLFVKLPDWFKIDTPLGSYNPDWAVVFDKNGVERLYFVIETKGSIHREDLRETEQKKIECGRKHFKAIDPEVSFEQASGYDMWRSQI
jgi:type III restriction enzyme